MIHRPGAGGGEWARPRSWAEPARLSEIPAHPPRAAEMVGRRAGGNRAAGAAPPRLRRRPAEARGGEEAFSESRCSRFYTL